MEIFLIVMIVVVILVVVLVNQDQPLDERLQLADSPARITLEEASQINRIAHLRTLSLDLACELAARLQGDAWQIAHSELCAPLLGDGRAPMAMELLSRLDTHHRGIAVQRMLSHWIDTGDMQQAVSLLEQLGGDLPQDALLRIPLLQATDRHEQALAELDALGTQALQPDSELRDLQLPTLARLQRKAERTEEAKNTLALAWQRMQARAAEDDFLGVDELAQELACLGQLQTLEEIARQLPDARNNPLISPLIEAGLFEQASLLIERLESFYRDQPYEQLQSAMLQRGQLQLATELMAKAESSLHSSLLLQLAQWHIEQGALTEATGVIQNLCRDEYERIDLCLKLWRLYVGPKPDFAAPLLNQAEHQVQALPAEERAYLRFSILDARLTAQSWLPERQRTSDEIHRGIQEMDRLIREMDTDSRASSLLVLAQVLHKLGRTADALAKLDEAGTLVRHSGPEDELDDFDKALLLEALSETYLQLGHLDQAISTRGEISQADSGRSGWVAALVDGDHLELAIEHLGFLDLFYPTQPLKQLFNKVQKLIDEAAPQAQVLRLRLLEKLDSTAFWQTTATE